MNTERNKRQFWATRAGSEEREAEMRIARQQGLELFELKSQVEAFGMAYTSEHTNAKTEPMK